MFTINKYYTIFLFVLLFFSSESLVYSQTGWVQISSGTTFDLNDIQFLDANTGYIVGLRFSPDGGIVRKTTNGGTTWVTQLTATTQIYGMYFLNALTGTVVGGLGFIRKTITGGAFWGSQTAQGNPSLFEIYFLNENIGAIVGAIGNGANGTIFYTLDGGTTWLDRSYGHDHLYYDVRFFDANTGIVVGNGSTSGIVKTTNAGLNWVYLSQFDILYGISALDQNNIVSCGGSNTIIKTTNGGNNWSLLNQSNCCSDLNSIFYIDINNFVAVGDTGAIYRTTNGGTNFIRQQSGVITTLQKVTFINFTTGWACGDNGVILKTTTGGFTAIQPISNEIPNQFSLSQNYPNPFNPNTIIRFKIQDSRLTTLKVFDVLGREVAALVNEQLKHGTYEVDWDGSNFSSGVYFYKLTAGDYTETKKMVLIK